MAVEEVGIRLNLQQRRQTVSGLREVRDELGDVAEAGQDVEASGKAAARGLERATDSRFVRGFDRISSSAGGLVTGLGRGVVGATRAVATGLGILSVAAFGAGVASIGLAGDARETASAFDTVFGPAARGVQKDLDGLTNRFGLYNPELQDAARQFGVFGKAAGVARKELPTFSTDLTRAGLDLSSFYNVDPGTAFEALQSGLSGEAEPLRQFGIFISDATMKAKAATIGLTGELTEQQKVMVRQQLILGNLGDAQGDLERTSKGFANQQRSATGQTKSFLTMLGGPLSTAATGAFKGFNAIARRGISMLEDRLPSLETKAQKLSRTFARWGRQLAHDLPGSIATATTAWDSWSAKLSTFTSGGSGAELKDLRKNLEKLGPVAADLSAELPGLHDLLSVTNIVTGFLADHTDELGKAMPYLIGGYVALKVSQLAANVALAASLPLKVAELFTNRALVKSNREMVASRAAVVATTLAETGAITAHTGAQNAGILARGRALVGMAAQKVALIGGAVATGVVTAAQWAWNVALTANPIGLVIVGVAALAGGIFLLWKKSETFRAAVGFLWNSVLKPFGKFIGGVLVGYFKLLGNAYLTMARFGLKAFRWLLTAAFATFDGILSAAEKGLGWVPGLGDKIRGARRAFNDFGDATIGKLEQLDAKLKATQDRINGIAKDRSATITITTTNIAETVTARRQNNGNGAPPSAGGASGASPRRVAAPSPLLAPEFDAAGSAASAEREYAAAGGGGDGRPIVLQNVIDGQVVGERVVAHVRGKLARR